MKRLILMAACLIGCVSLNAQQKEDFSPFYKYRVYLKDKKHSPYSLSRPEEFLSEKAIARRKKQRIKLDTSDLPVNRNYIDQVAACGVKPLHSSKWNNTVLVQTSDTAVMEQVKSLAFVDSIRKVATYSTPIPLPDPKRKNKVKSSEKEEKKINFFEGVIDDLVANNLNASYLYGLAYNQIKMLNGIRLHEQGFRGQGMTIAVIDGGFSNVDAIPYFNHVKILGTKDFALEGGNVYDEEEHGTMVLSCMACNSRGQIVGTAPEASYWLLRSEDGHTEQLVEEDNWCAAIEYADSVGADVVNTSLGYTEYDNKADNVRYWELDGKTHLASRSASMVASKGMILCQAAGNDAFFSSWKLIGVPADGKDILTVGALNAKGINTNFSSLGPSADGRVKPDVCAQGENCALVNERGKVTFADGTSFASPITCGMVACFWQAHPELDALEVMDRIRKSGHNASHPDNVFGYGIPDYNN